METPQYIKSLLIRNGKKSGGRKVWSIDLETIWLPFFYAAKIMGESTISPEALGAPIRLQYDADGAVKFSRTGRPLTKVVKEISDEVRLVRDNFTASLVSYANGVISENPDRYKELIEEAKKAGEPIVMRDKVNLDQALAQMRERELAEAHAKVKAKPKEKVVATA